MEYGEFGYEVDHEVGNLGQFQETKLVSCFRGDEFGVSSVSFDPQEDLLWAATYGGHLTSFYSSSLEKYTAFQAHHDDVRQLQPTMSGILSITGKELRLTSRTGLPIFTMSDEQSLNDMNCALYLNDNALLVGCQSNKITTVDLTQSQVTGETPTNAGICLLKPSEQYICSGDVNGHVYMLDPNSLQVVGSFAAHTAGMCDMDVVGYYLVTCGLTQQYGQLCVDCQLRVFDLRAIRPIPPCDVTMLQPFLVRCVPALNSTVMVLSQMGEFQFLDIRGLVTPSNMVVHQLTTCTEGAMACAMDVGPTCQCLAFGDSCGVVHMWSNQENVIMNPYAQPSVFPDEVQETLPHISWDEEDKESVPFSAVPMALAPHEHGPLASDWPVAHSKFTRRMAPVIDPEVLANMRMIQFVGHAPKPAHILRNQVPYDLEREMRASVPESPMMREDNPLSLIPKSFRQVEIKYSKLGIEAFDFGHYNDTKFAGLEIHIPNAYCNSMLQVLYFMEPIRSSMQNHLCSKEFCLSCELGFLFRMLDHSAGQSCQASNFLRAFRTLREASALGLLLSWENEEKKANLAKLIQNWNRFVLQQLNQELQPQHTSENTCSTGSEPDSPTSPSGAVSSEAILKEGERKISVIEQLFGSEIVTLIECPCGWSTTTQRTELLFSLIYPHNTDPAPTPFSSILQQSICRQQRLHCWCEKCIKYKSTTQQRSLGALPRVLSLNCQIESDQDHAFWRYQQTSTPCTSRWIPLSMRLTLAEGNKLEVTELPIRDVGSGMGSETDSCDRRHTAVFDLMMTVSHVKETWMETPGNLVTHIRVGSTYHLRKEGASKTQWYLFNDFHITPLRENEIGVFPAEWLTPCILIYAQRDYLDQCDTDITCKLDAGVLLAETHHLRPVRSPATFTPLTFSELPNKGDLAGIDAEFVILNQEEAEVKSDGTHTTLKPSQLCVARITVTRGKGPMEGSPFIDDYIATSEQVVDYLTKFSGIKPGDLDATMSSKHLTTLKASYLKLLYLVETGVVFIGHGLKKDFRVINILVPPEQVIDTVSLFHLPNQRYISLKFLAWFYASLHIQEGSHDSAEDARTALLLYRKYRDLEASNTMNESLCRLYETGRKCGWQVPERT